MPRTLPLLLIAAACAGRPIDADVDRLVDSDGDGILDVHEGDADPDGDGVPALLDLDSDDDGIPDADEAGDVDLLTAPFDSDGDQVPDFLDLDSDGNGMPDEDEGRAGPTLLDRDRDGIIDSSDLDDDDDRVPDVLEMVDGRDQDSDVDQRVDRLDKDSDNDGLRDLDEGTCGGPQPCDTDGDGTPDRLDDDSDDDGLSDRYESGVQTGLAIPAPDTDGDGLHDARDPDSDGDGLTDAEEIAGPTDGLLWDTDGDGLSDYVEGQLGLDPVDAESRWSGPMASVQARHEVEVALRGTIGLEKLDVVLMMPSLKEAHLWSSYLFDGWSSLPPPARSVAFSFVHVGSFGRQPWGCSEDPTSCGFADDVEILPQRAAYVAVPMTTHTARASSWARTELDIVTAALSGTTRFNYSEALVQIATGSGYDVDCDGTFDERIDQPAWPPTPGDLFDGASTPAWDATLFEPLGQEGAVGFRPGSARLLFPTDRVFPQRCAPYHQPFASAPADLPDVDQRLFEGPELCRPYSTWDDAAEALSQARAWVAYRTSIREPPTAEGCTQAPELGGYDTLPALGVATGSAGDLDGDGHIEPYHVQNVLFIDSLTHEDNLRRRYREEARPLLADIRRRLDPDLVVAHVRSDPHGFVMGITPGQIVDPDYDDTFELQVDLRGTVPPEEGDRAYLVEVALVGDGHWDMYTQTLLVIVPGWTRM